MLRLSFGVAAVAFAAGITSADNQSILCNSLGNCTYNGEVCLAIVLDASASSCGFQCTESGLSVDGSCKLADPLFYCEDEDAWVERFTVVRYAVLGLVVLYRVVRIIQKGSSGPDEEIGPFALHPEVAKKMIENADRGGVIGGSKALVFAAWLFVQTEGIGLTVYFATAATLDNFSIFLASGQTFCEWVIMVALYTCALLTFLPNCVLAYTLQERMYDKGTLFAKACFIVMMVVATGMLFLIRLHVVYEYGWATCVHSFFEFDRRAQEGVDWRQVFVAGITPPLVDLLQSTLLIASSSWRAEFQYRKLAGNSEDP